jgi:hypothetical protein
VPERLYRTLPADVVAIVRSYPPMVVWFAAGLAGLALVFDVFYLVASPGPVLAAVYAVPVLAGVVAGLVAAAEDVGLERRVLVWTVGAAVALGITNLVVVAMLSAIRRTDPSNWGAGGESVLLAVGVVLAVGVTAVVLGNLIDALGIKLRTRRRRRPPAVPVPARAVALAEPRAPKQKPKPKPVPVQAEPEYADEYFGPAPVVSYEPRVVDLEGPRQVVSAGDGTAHADRRAVRPNRVPAVPRSRRTDRPGRRPRR